METPYSILELIYWLISNANIWCSKHYNEIFHQYIYPNIFVGLFFVNVRLREPEKEGKMWSVLILIYVINSTSPLVYLGIKWVYGKHISQLTGMTDCWVLHTLKMKTWSFIWTHWCKLYSLLLNLDAYDRDCHRNK